MTEVTHDYFSITPFANLSVNLVKHFNIDRADWRKFEKKKIYLWYPEDEPQNCYPEARGAKVLFFIS